MLLSLSPYFKVLLLINFNLGNTCAGCIFNSRNSQWNQVFVNPPLTEDEGHWHWGKNTSSPALVIEMCGREPAIQGSTETVRTPSTRELNRSVLLGPIPSPYLLAVLDHTFFVTKCITEKKFLFFTDFRSLLKIYGCLWRRRGLALNLSSVFPLWVLLWKVLLERRQFMQGWERAGQGSSE